jgi:pimeloyl-ACP methyl ester carboxylesterase
MVSSMDKLSNFIKSFQQHTLDMLMLSTKITIDDSTYVNTSCQTLFNFTQQYLSLFSETPETLSKSATEYYIDYLQRTILFWDIFRKRGNQYYEYIAAGQPPVLIFEYEMIIDGRTLKRPVNYALVEIIPPKHVVIDKTKRPYVIIDPRAGHGSGIGGFKDDSQVGVALNAGNPVYFVIFFPEPEPGQTLHDIITAEETFLRTIHHRHPDSPKPCLIGNCQGGWAAMSLVAAHPDIAGAIVINGAPLAYWAGQNGKNPMRYTGGILGGSWLAQFAGDLGHGKFDGANLVMNFELLNPANTYWKKYYNLFSNIDTEEEDFLAFERWWGGFILLNTNEMRSIVDNLFIGNKLAHGKIPLNRNKNIDLRNIRLPIIIFCSEGDNITPPEQALHWIADIYPNTLELKLAGQIIVYLIHQTVGHLGIFVSSQIAKKEHSQILDLLDHIEHLPPGIYEMIIQDESSTDDSLPCYHAVLKERNIENIFTINSKDNINKNEELFNIVHAISELNSSIYDIYFSPLVQITSNDLFAEILRELHPLRITRYIFSDQQLIFSPLAHLAKQIKSHRKIMIDNNLFFNLQKRFSEFMIAGLDTYREYRDSNLELWFHHFYGLLNILLPTDLPFRRKLHSDLSTTEDSELIQHILSTIEDGGVPEAILRILLVILKRETTPKFKHISHSIKELRNSKAFMHLTDNAFRAIVHTQTVIVEYDLELALLTLPALIPTQHERDEVKNTVNFILKLLNIKLSEQCKQIINKYFCTID